MTHEMEDFTNTESCEDLKMNSYIYIYMRVASVMIRSVGRVNLDKRF